MTMLALEPRILFDAAALVDFTETYNASEDTTITGTSVDEEYTFTVPISDDDGNNGKGNNIYKVDISNPNYGGDGTFDVLLGELDGAGYSYDTTLVDDADLGNLTFNADGSFTYIAPGVSEDTTDSFVYQISVSDDVGEIQKTVTITTIINISNDLYPIASNDSFTFTENESSTYTGDVSLNDTAGNGASTYTLTNPVDDLALNTNGTFTYTPPAISEDKTVSFAYTMTDESGEVTTALATISITNNIYPTANNDVFDFTETVQNTYTGTVSSNDTNGNGIATYSLTNSVDNLIMNSNGTFTYTPPTVGSDQTLTFAYTMTDNAGDTSEATATINITNDIYPVAVNDVFNFVETTQNTYTGTVSSNDTNGNGTAIYTLDENVNYLTLNTNGTFTYTPPAIGEDKTVSFTYTMTDSASEQTNATATINITNDIYPIAVNDIFTFDENNTNIYTGTLATNDTAGNAPTVYSLMTPVAGLTVNTNGSFVYNSGTVEDNKTVSFTYQVTDAGGNTSTASATITIVNDNQIPVANNDRFTVNESAGTITGSVATNDIKGDGTNTYALLGSYDNLTFNSNGTFTYTGYETMSFQYVITDLQGDTSVGTTTVTVINDVQPIAVSDAIIFLESDANVYIGTVATNDSFGTGSNIYTLATSYNNLEMTPDGQFKYTGEESITFAYVITDSRGDSSQATSTIQVLDPPSYVAMLSLYDTLDTSFDYDFASGEGEMFISDTVNGEYSSLVEGRATGDRFDNLQGMTPEQLLLAGADPSQVFDATAAGEFSDQIDEEFTKEQQEVFGLLDDVTKLFCK